MDGFTKIRVIITKVGLDGHERGAKLVATLLMNAGLEVIYLGMHQTPESIVRAVMEEDADVIGLSCLSGEHLISAPRIARLLRQNNLGHVVFIVGGVIPDEDIPQLKQEGVWEVFGPGSFSGSIVDYIKEKVVHNN